MNEHIQGEFLRKRMIELREKNHMSQSDMAALLVVNKSTLSRVERGNSGYKTNLEYAKMYCDKLGLTDQQQEIFMRGERIVVTDTSALLKNMQLIDELSKEYGKVIVPRIVIDELDNIKGHSPRALASRAWQILRSIGSNQNVITMEYNGDDPGDNNDSKIIAVAEAAAERFHCSVDIITYDAGFAARLSGEKTIHALFLENYMVTKQDLSDIDSLKKLDAYYADSYEDVEKVLGIPVLSKEDINAYLATENTLIISAVRSKHPLRQRIAKIRWLIEHDADINRRDCGKYYFPPLSHAIQINDFEMFKFLLHDCQADPNIGSRNPYHDILRPAGTSFINLINLFYEEERAMLHERYYIEKAKQEELLARKNVKSGFYNGIYERWQYPVLTRAHIPLTWRYDLNPATNPYFMERLGVNAVMNSGAIYLNGKYYLVARIEGNDRKSFFGVAESDNGVEGFRFRDYPILLEDTCPEETNVYDMRLTQHEDGWIYGVFCSESKDTTTADLSAAVAAAGIVRTKDLKHWERLENLITLHSPQQRNVVLHPEFVDGKYAFYTRPMDDFIDTGSGGGIGFGLCDDITHAVIDEERMTSLRKYHTITEVKNGAGAVPIKTERGWLHIAHGVRNTAAGLRYVIYAFATDLEDPGKVIAEPSGLLIGPQSHERVGDVSNVVFTNGAIVNEKDEVFIYYASSDTRMHVATTTLDRLTDYVFNTPSDPGRSVECVAQRCGLIEKNLEFLKNNS